MMTLCREKRADEGPSSEQKTSDPMRDFVKMGLDEEKDKNAKITKTLNEKAENVSQTAQGKDVEEKKENDKETTKKSPEKTDEKSEDNRPGKERLKSSDCSRIPKHFYPHQHLCGLSRGRTRSKPRASSSRTREKSSNSKIMGRKMGRTRRRSLCLLLIPPLPETKPRSGCPRRWPRSSYRGRIPTDQGKS